MERILNIVGKVVGYRIIEYLKRKFFRKGKLYVQPYGAKSNSSDTELGLYKCNVGDKYFFVVDFREAITFTQEGEYYYVSSRKTDTKRVVISLNRKDIDRVTIGEEPGTLYVFIGMVSSFCASNDVPENIKVWRGIV